MSFLFPHKEDITLKAPPLSEVICQIRFAPILRIAGSLPIDYQDHIRQRFPSLLKKDLSASQIVSQPGEFIFETANGLSNTSLAINFVAVVSCEYLHWQSFSLDLELVFNAFEQAYGKILATRIGLRYVNQLQFSNTGTDSLDDLLDFFNPDLTYLYKNPILNKPNKIANFVSLSDEDVNLALRTGIDSTSEASVFLDFDCYQEFEIPIEKNAITLLKELDNFHRIIYNAFRWSIREEKIGAFRPVGTES